MANNPEPNFREILGCVIFPYPLMEGSYRSVDFFDYTGFGTFEGFHPYSTFSRGCAKNPDLLLISSTWEILSKNLFLLGCCISLPYLKFKFKFTLNF